ncbi:hypothetical protein [Microbacterium sp. E-13]|uniref:hypothetical protein n=1 Tax=Microbacterium sp. E-13 TaxID=3404048 RepID=UPI003CF0D2B7
MTLSARAQNTVGRRLAMTTTAILVGAMLPFLAAPAAASAAVSETEPNNSTSQADVIAAGTAVSGSTSSQYSTESDYFAVDLPSAGRVSLDLKFPSNLGAGDVYSVDVYDASATKLYHFDVTGNRYDGSWLRSFATYAPAGRLYVRIYGQNNWASWGQTYTFTPGFTAGSVETEFNNYTSDADVIPVGTGVSGSTLSHYSTESDYFAVDLPSAGRVSLDLKFPSNLGAGDVYSVDVYDASATKLYHFDVTGNRYDGSWLRSFATYAPAGRLYVRIYGQNNWASWGQTYTFTPGFTAGSVETEFNNYTSDADVIPVGTGVSGSTLSHYSTESDYFAVDLPSAGRVSLDLKFPSNLGAGDVYSVDVYDASATKLYHFDVTGNRYDGSWLRSFATYAPAGRLYVRIYGQNNWASWGQTYTFTPGFTAGSVETEFNNSTSDADVTPVGTGVSGSTLSHYSTESDYFAFDVAAARNLSLLLKFPSNLGSADVYDVDVYDASGTRLYHFDVTGNRYDGSWLAPQYIRVAAGRTYVRISGQNNWTSWGKAYTLTARYVFTQTPVPTISGTAKVGSTLTANTGTWSPTPTTFAYQWLRNGTAISGATSATYKLVTADAGKSLTVKVTGSRNAYRTITKTSAAKAIPQ